MKTETTITDPNAIRILMFGWELPPFNSGGLGVACWGLTKALADEGVAITFVLPKKVAITCDFMNIIFANESKDVLFYKRLQAYTSSLSKNGSLGGNSYFESLLEEVKKFAQFATEIATRESFDIIHAHDWLTFQAGINAEKVKNTPLIAHVHATEFDRTGNLSINQEVYTIEKQGMHYANDVIAVSNLTKNIMTNHYDIPSSKITVVHNGVEKTNGNFPKKELLALKKHNKIILFVGRLTMQKGPDYFIRAAQKVLKHDPNVFFVIVGSGEMKESLVREVASMGLSDKIIFTGFLRDEELEKIYKSADLFVMPSVSEPFGITGLESAINGTPVLVSKQSGVSEVLTHSLKVDFWDIHEMANKIIAVLAHRSLKKTLKENGFWQAQEQNWEHAAKKVKNIYIQALDKKSSQNQILL